MEGIGYTFTDIVVTARPINASATQFMFDINLVGYTFDMGDMVFDDEPTLSDTQSRQSDTPDRDDYWKIPKASKFDYGDRDWYNPKNAVIFFDNTVFSLINSLIDLANGPIISSQIGYHEGVDAWWDNEKKGAKALVNAPINYAKSTYNYATTTPFSKQMSDLGRDLSNPHQWEDGVAMALSLYGGGYGMASKAGIAGKSSGMLTKIPSGAKITPPFPILNDGWGLFGKNGLVIKNYRIDIMYQNTTYGTGTYFSIKSLNKGGNLFRLDRGYIHGTTVIKLHSTVRFYYKGVKYGSTGQRKWYPSSLKAPFFKEIDIPK